MPNKKRLFLVDGMSNIFRSYYAIRGLSNSKGLPTNSTYGFTVTLRKLMKDHRPDYLGVVLDSKEMTFRQEQYADYKAHRPDMPEDLVAQLPYILRVCEALRVPVLRMPRYEADDIIGALAKQATEAGLQTVVVTNDKDLSQLVRDDEVLMLRMDKNGENLLNEDGVKAKYGVRPDQIVDWLGLMGDAVDGIPGAPGIGEKGAASLLAEFGTIDNALANWEQVKKKTYRESLRDHADQIRFSRELARIDLNVPVKLDLEALIVEEPDQKLAYELFNELEFAQLKQEFKGGAKPGEAAAVNKQEGAASYRRITKVEDLRRLVKTFYDREQFAFALSETESGKLGVAAFSTSSGSADYFDFENCDDPKEAVNLLKDAFGNGLIEKSTHDLKGATRLLEGLGVELENVTDDTMLQAYLLDSDRTKYELPQLASEYLDHSITTGEESTIAQYADATGRLADVLNARILEDKIQYDFQQEKLDFVYRKIEMPLIPLLYEMEEAGFRVSTGVLEKLSVEMEKELDKLSKKIYELAGREFNIGSPQQLGEIFEELNYEVSRRTATGKIATSRDVLDELAEKYELPRLIIEHRELAKLKGTYVDAFPQLINPSDGRIRTTLNQTIAATGRLSCLPAGTFVNTQHGLVGIESVRPGDLIRTPYGPRRVLDWQATGEKPVVVLKLSNGITLRCSLDHRIRSKGEWIEAGRLKVGAPVYMSFVEGIFGKETRLHWRPIAAYPTRKTPVLPILWTKELAEFVGYLMADGHIAGSNYNNKPVKVILSFGWDDDELVKRFATIIKQTFGKEPTYRTTKSCPVLEVSGVDIAGGLEQLGAGGKSGDIRVPPSIFNAPEEIVAAFLRGYFEGDGCASSTSAQIFVRSTSRGMLEDVQQLLTLFGIPSNLKGGEPDPRGYAPRYTLAILGDRSKRVFQKQIGFLTKKKQQNCVAMLARQGVKSAAESLTLLPEFDLAPLKSAIYETHRQSNGRVPQSLMVFASRFVRGCQTMRLSRAEWILSSLSPETDLGQAGFLQEAVSAQYYEVQVADISYEAAVPMYDIAVEEVEQYMAQGIVVHNSISPNLQNIPIRTEMGRRIRRAFIPADGHVLLSADYSQIELRLLAHVTKDEVMLETFRKGEDIHARTAAAVFKAKTAEEMKDARRKAKIVNFGIAYVIGPFGLAQRVGISRNEAKKVIDEYYQTYAGVKKYMDELPDRARENGCEVRSIFGRKRRVPDLEGKGSARARAEREAVNMPMQGSASDIVKLAMLRVAESLRREKLKARMILQVHDELVFEVPKKEVEKTGQVVKAAMENAAKIAAPLIVEIGVGENWVDAKP